MNLKWTQKQSLRLTLVVTVLFFLAIIVVLFNLPYFVNLVLPLKSAYKHMNVTYCYMTLYAALLVMLVILVLLACLVRNIQKEIVFEAVNIRYLRLISWLCILLAFILLVSAVYHFPWIVLAVAAAFMALIVRVIKNVFCQALLIKEENEFTI